MDIFEIEKKIIKECLSENSFLVLIHSKSFFDKDKYENIIADIRLYAELLGENKYINRSVAACLLEIMLIITSSLFSLKEENSQFLSDLQTAHVEISDLLHSKVFRIEFEDS